MASTDQSKEDERGIVGDSWTNESGITNGAEGREALPKLLRRFWLWSAVAFGLMLVIGDVERRMGYPDSHYNPLSFPLFGDLMEYLGTFQWLHTTTFFFNVSGKPITFPLFSPVTYPPFAVVVLAAIYSGASPVLLYLEIAAVWLTAVVLGVRYTLVQYKIGATTALLFPLTLILMSYPITRLLVEGNLELLLWILTATGAWAYLRESDNTAAVLWALAGAMKLYPGILLILLLPRRRWRSFALGVTTLVGVTLLSLWWIGPTMGVAWRGWIQILIGFQEERSTQWNMVQLASNHSFFSLVKLGAMLGGLALGKLMLPYYLCGAVTISWAFFGRLWRMPAINQLLSVSLFMVIFPPISYAHALVQLYAPLLALLMLAIRADRTNVSITGLRGTVLLFVPLFAAYTLFTFRAVLLFDGLVQSVLLLILFGCALRFPFAINDA